jgi:hypothetical protein
MSYRIVMASVLAVAAAAPATAQTVSVMRENHAAEHEAQAVMSFHAESVVESRITEGRPYAAEATTEFVQVLGDGNRISRRTTVRVFRDGEGRTRREELGTGDAPESISIYDPVSHVTYVLDPVRRVAHKSAVRIVYPTAIADKVTGKARIEGKIALVPPTEMAVSVVPEAIEHHRFMDANKHTTEPVGHAGLVVSTKMRGAPGDATTESLGEQMIGGVRAEGSRTTTIVPAGAIGNQQEIRIVSEQWFSPDLQVLVMTRHSDPRSGDVTYRLSNIIRAEPGAGLFDVPADYTVRESSYMKAPALR